MAKLQPRLSKTYKIDILSQSIAIIAALIAMPARAEVLEIDFKLAKISQDSAISAQLFSHTNLPQLNSPQPAAMPSEPDAGTQASSEPKQDQDSKQRIVVKGRKTHWERAKPFEVSYQALNIIDAAGTIICLSRNTCIEKNPLLGKRPSVGKILAVKTATGVAHFYVAKWLGEKHPDAVLPFEYLTIAIQGGVVAMNFRHIF